MKEIILDEHTGIDILVNLVESSILSVNTQLYGDLHNMGHFMSAFIHDPDGRNLVSSITFQNGYREIHLNFFF